MMLAVVLALTGCKNPQATDPPPPINPTDWTGHGPFQESLTGPLGTPVSHATPEQRATFERGLAVGLHRFAPSEGLGPAFNAAFCLSCHEKPVSGGSAGLYRSFFLTGRRTVDGAFIPGESAGMGGGVLRLNYFGDEYDARPEVPETTTIVAQRNPIPFFGVGLIAEIGEDQILRWADPDDRNGDGISGRPNYDRGFVGRFGRKAQTVSIEGFIRGPLFNHLGITSDPLTDAQRAALPIDSSSISQTGAMQRLIDGLTDLGQAAAPDGPLTDEDGVPDPELSTDDLFDLVSYAMLLAAPRPEPLNEQTTRGRDAFNQARCFDCHVPRLFGPRGPLAIYSDLLLHDMGPDLDDGLAQKDATGAEFRTQPLWGLASAGPYLHDGRAETLHDAILWHGGEGQTARDVYDGFDSETQADLVAFLESLGGRDQLSTGLVPVDATPRPVGSYGGPVTELSAEDEARFLAGRAAFDHDHSYSQGVGGPRFNGDSCRACHFEPTIGGSGPVGLNVVRHGLKNGNGDFVAPTVGTILHRLRVIDDQANRPQDETVIYEFRQAPHLYGLGMIDAIPEATIMANADPSDSDDDGISGRVPYTDGGRVGRFGWKGSVPSIAEFVRDAVTMELGMTLPQEEGLTFGRVQDNDDVPDPELPLSFAHDVQTYLTLLGPPPRLEGDFGAGEALFAQFGCADCHIPALEGPNGPVPLYSDLLLHEVLPPDAPGIEEASANTREFRTAPLWGLRSSGPYLHHGRAETLRDAIAGHDGEAAASRDAVDAADPADVQLLLDFLGSL